MIKFPDVYPVHIPDAVRTALIAAGWDGYDPSLCVDMTFALADEMHAAGCSIPAIAVTFRIIANALDDIAESGVIE